MPMSKLKAALLNRRRVDPNLDLNLAALHEAADLALYDGVGESVDAVATGCEVLITKEVPIDPEMMSTLASRGVRLICEAGTGYDNLSIAAARDVGIEVRNVPNYSMAAVAQLTMSFVLGIAAGTLGSVRRTSRGDYSEFGGTPWPTFEVKDKVIGIVGPGSIGLTVARRARDFDMLVLTSGRRPRTWDDDGMRDVSLPELLEKSDFISLHCPLRRGLGNDHTVHLIDAEALSRMQRHAWLLNTSRGGLVDELALFAAVNCGSIAGAALDVHELEPQAPRPELQLSDRIYLTPHAGCGPREARQRLLDEVAENIVAFNAGSARNVVT